MRSISGAVLLLILLSGLAQAAEPIPVEDFVAHPKYRNLQISPDGQHLAVIAPVDGINHLVFLNISNVDRPEQVGVLQAPKGEEVATISWVNNERVIFQTSVIQGSLEIPRLTGRIMAANYDGTKKKVLWSVQKEKTFPQVLDTIEDDDDFIIVSHQGINRAKPIVERLNVYSGKSRRFGVSPLNRGSVLLDDDQNLRFAIGIDDELEWHDRHNKHKSNYLVSGQHTFSFAKHLI